MASPSAATLIKQLNLEAHIEGGFFRRTFTSQKNHQQQAYCSSIYYLLCTSSPLGHLHKNRSEIMHYHHSGGPLKYTLVSPDGELSEVLLGSDINKGEQPQLLVEAGYWKATELLQAEDSPVDYALISEVVIPEFCYQDMELATFATIRKQHPEIIDRLQALIKPDHSNH